MDRDALNRLATRLDSAAGRIARGEDIPREEVEALDALGDGRLVVVMPRDGRVGPFRR